jgi:hypothetical protein
MRNMHQTPRIIALLIAIAICLAMPAGALAHAEETLPPDSTVQPGITHPYQLTPAYGLHAHWAWLQGKSDGSNIAAHGGHSRCGTAVTSASTATATTAPTPSCDGNDRIVIAVLDSGVDTSLPAFQGDGKLQPGLDCSHGHNGTPDYAYDCSSLAGEGQTDATGHGTRVAGIALGQGNAPGQYGDGVYGVAPGAALMSIKIGYENASFAAAIIAATKKGADVINISSGGSTETSDLADALLLAHNAGVIVTCSSGNGNGATGHATIDYPGPDGGDDSWQVPNDSSWGPAGQVDFAAPGSDVTAIKAHLGASTPYAPASDAAGTSFSSPAIAGAAAVLLANGVASGAAPNNVAATVIARLAATARPVGTTAQTGAGLPDLGAAFGLAKPMHEVSDPVPPSGGTGGTGGSTGGGGATPTPANPAPCTGLHLSVPVAGRVAFASRLCTGAYTVTRGPEPALGTIRLGTYIAPAARIGTTSFDVTSVSGRFVQTVTIVVTRQVVKIARPRVRCAAYKVRGRIVRGSKRCSISSTVPVLAGGGHATAVIQRAVRTRVHGHVKIVWKAAGSCSLAATGNAASCVKVLGAGSYRASVSVGATSLHGAAMSSYGSFAA